MKAKVLIAMILCVFGIEVLAQTQYNPYVVDKRIPSGVGFQFGFARDLLRERKGDNESKKFPFVTDLDGLKIGVVYDATIIKGFGVSMALNYTIAGDPGKWMTPQDKPLKKEKTTRLFQSIDIPIDWQYKFEIAKETYLILYTGPTIQYNFYFKETYQSEENILGKIVQENKTTNHYAIDADADGVTDYSQLNIMWGVGAGFQYQRYFLRGGYDFGIYNPYKDRFIDNQGKYNNGRLDQWSLKIGMYLWEF